jgi:hypothetical protein
VLMKASHNCKRVVAPTLSSVSCLQNSSLCAAAHCCCHL